ncbi:ATP phosphoribosyltransferase regulatory subunit [Candidatus Soleaferrea massiliensis]|uniref:ATP phosphoribosyltransferase regulatory subunit n=1 Tax=Candidatus Soleaferrea massiliensis TaxID=1470354 RepID=UPI00058D2E13|nr:ATP phosphoribosyltransferase regulatory subunit [Candidatus Soleaferrea massiliensis]
MSRYDLVTPQGTKDLLFEQCSVRRAVQQKMTKKFSDRGFHEVITPGIEFFDVFDTSSRYLPQEIMYKLVDNKGRLLVMRPDNTTPIARLAATRLKNEPMPLRLYYHQNVYRVSPSLKGRSDETIQMGVELIGSGSAKADLEIIGMAASCLREFSPDYRIEIGHSGFFKILSESLPADRRTKRDIQKAIESKNYAALNDLLDSLEASEASAALKQLPRLFGGEEVFPAAAALFHDDRAREILDSLEKLYHNLKALGLGENIMLDLGLANSHDYYTGVIFTGYLQGIGEPVLSGGRYDNLLIEFGADLPAIGFGLDVDSVSKFLMEKDPSGRSRPADMLVHANEGYCIQALGYLSRKIAENNVCEYSCFDSVEDAKSYCKEKGIRELHIVDETTTIMGL